MLIKRPSEITHEEFIRIYGNIYEHSPWIAEAAWHHRDEGSLDRFEALHAAMKTAIANGDETQQLALICAHPDLAVAPAELGKLTQASQSEQTGAGLKQCTPEEFAEFQKLNADYKSKFGFPFIVAVKGLTRHDILNAFRKRIHSTREAEFYTALEQINRIAYFRLEALSEKF